MKIENLKSEKKGNKARVSATVIWEDCDRPTQEVFFETDETFAQGLSCNPHSFLVGCIMPAMHHGEERIFIDAEISPEMRDGLLAAMGWIRHWWYEDNRRLVRIEVKTRSRRVTQRIPERAGIFFSGGIDSIGTLRANRLNFPSEHPWSIKDGLLVYGLEINDQENFEKVVNSLADLAREAGIIFIPVYTNVRYLNDDWTFWEHVFHDAVFSAIAHAFSQRLTVVSIASTYAIPDIKPYGTHPLLDQCYSSSDLLIRHDGITLTRLDKTKLVADWDVALQKIRVCNKSDLYRTDMLNCGKCEKCVRTMLAFLALGVLEKSRAFPADNVSEELLWLTIKIHKRILCFYEELIPPLAGKGRHDLVHVIERKIAEYHKCQKIYNRKSKVRQKLKQFDSKYLYGSLFEFKKLISHKRPKESC